MVRHNLRLTVRGMTLHDVHARTRALRGNQPLVQALMVSRVELETLQSAR